MQNAILNIREITSNGTTNLIVTTDNNHGLVPGITVSFINSQNFIRRVVQANAVNISNVLVNEINATAFNIGDTPVLNQSNGYLYSQIIPYNWLSANIIYMPASGLNTATPNVMVTPVNHGFNDVDDYAVFVQTPPGSNVRAGGSANLATGQGAVYWANVVSANTLCLKLFSRYGASNGSVVARYLANVTSNLTTYPFLFMKNVVEVSQVYANGLIEFRSNHNCQNLDKIVFANLSSVAYPATVPLVRVNNALNNGDDRFNANLYSYSVYVQGPRTVYISNTIGDRPISSFASVVPNPLLTTNANLFMIRLNQSFTEHNSIYWPNHGFTQNTSVIATGNIGGLVPNYYYIDVVNSNRIRLLRSVNTFNYVDFSNVGYEKTGQALWTSGNLIQINSDWNTRIDGTGNEVFRGITSENGNVFVATNFTSNPVTLYSSGGGAFGTTCALVGTENSLIAKYNSSGTVQWVSNLSVAANAVLVNCLENESGTSNIYCGGRYNGTLSFVNGDRTTFGTTLSILGVQSGFIAKYNTNGTVQWNARMGGTGNNDAVYNMASDPSQNVYVCGTSNSVTFTAYNSSATGGAGFATTLSRSGVADGFILKYNTNGAVQWVAKQGNTLGSTLTVGVTADATNVYALGTYSGSNLTVFNSSGTSFANVLPNAAAGDLFITKYDTNGNALWVIRAGGSGLETTDVLGRSIHVENSNVYICGDFRSNPLTFFDASGTQNVTLTSNLLLDGTQNAFLAKYDINGNFRWCTRIGGAGTDGAYSVRADQSGVTVVGYSSSATIFIFNKDGSIDWQLGQGGVNDGFMVEYTHDGDYVTAARFNSGNVDDRAQEIHLEGSNIYVGGYFTTGGTYQLVNQFGTGIGGTLGSSGGLTAFLQKILYTSNLIGSRITAAGFHPQGHTFTIPNHNITNNDILVYESNGLAAFSNLSNLTTGFAKILNSNTFRLSPDTRELKVLSYDKYASSNIINVYYSNSITENVFNVGDTVTIANCNEFPDLNGFYNVWAVVTTSVPPYFRINLSSNVANSEISNASFSNAIAYRSFFLGSNGTVGQWHNFNHISTFDGQYKISSVPRSNTLVVDTGIQINDKYYAIDASNLLTLNVATDSFTYPNHSLPDGARVVYSNNGNENILGLSNGTTYFVVVNSANSFRLSNTYDSALSQSNIQQLAINQTGVHHFISNTCTGLSPVPGSVVSNVSDLTNFLESTTFSRFTTSLSVGERINIVPFSRPYIVTNVFSDSTFTVTPPIPSNSMIANATFTGNTILVSTNMFIDSSGYIQHRPFDGGVTLTTGTDPYTTVTRQTRTYFRYQSGKGLQMSSGTNFNPQNDTESVTSLNSNIIQIRTTKPHGLKPQIIGQSNIIVTGGIFGRFPVSAVVDDYNFNLRISNVGIGSFSGNTITITNPSVLSNLLTNSYPIGQNVYVGTSTAQIVGNTATSIFFSASSNLNGTSGERTFTVAPVLPSTLSGISQYLVETTTNVVVRIGMFDNQNGLFFEKSNGGIYCVRRSSTQQIPGRSIVTNGSSNVFGVGTLFTKNLATGNNIVIRGQSYMISNIISDTDINILPSYRGLSSNNVIVSLTRDLKVPQQQWSLDVCDGTGPSGFNLDLTKMQMIYMDYSWYGAGKVRFGFRRQNGEVFYCHEFIHGNIMNEAYMRSGNLPARYELQNDGYVFYQPYVNHWGTSVIMDGRYDDDKAYFFTGDSDTLTFTNGESIDFVGVTATAGSTLLTAVPSANAFAIRSGASINSTKSDGNLGGGRRYIPTNTRIVTGYINPSAPTTYIIQMSRAAANSGGSIVATVPGNLQVQSYVPIPLLSVRLAPSVDNSVTGPLGARDVINRMQLAMKSCDISVTHESTVQIFLNAELSYVNWTPVFAPSLAQIYRHQLGEKVTFGIPVFSFRVAGGSIGTSFSNVARNIETSTVDLSRLAILSNSILGGNGTFPNGPDVLTLCVTPVDTTIISGRSPFSATARISWTESQA